MRFYFQIDSSLSSNHAFLANVQWDAMEEDSYSVSKPLQSNVNPAHLDFSDDNARHKKGKARLSDQSFLPRAMLMILPRINILLLILNTIGINILLSILAAY